jgi:two-component system, cell cycle sensor histidine kinase and response regulator CckA
MTQKAPLSLSDMTATAPGLLLDLLRRVRPGFGKPKTPLWFDGLDKPVSLDTSIHSLWGAALVCGLGFVAAGLFGLATGLWQVGLAYLGIIATAVIIVLLWRLGPGRRVALHPARALLIAAVQSQREARAVTDREGRLICANSSYGEALGGYPSPFALAGDDAALAERIRASAHIPPGHAADAPAPVPIRSGSGVGYELTCKPVRDAAGHLIWDLSVASHEQLRRDASLAVATAVGDAMSASGVAACVTDLEGQILAANRFLAEQLGQRPVHLVGQPLQTYLKPTNDGGFELATATGERQAVRAGEAPLLAHMTSRAGAPSETAIGFAVSLAPILTQALAGDQAQAQLLPLEALMKVLPVGAAAIDAGGRVSLANKAMHALIGPDRPLLGEAPADLMLDLDRKTVLDAIRLVSSGQLERQELTVRLHWRPEEPIQLVLNALAGVPGVAALLTLKDDAEQRRLQQQFSQAQKMQAVGQLAGGIAHDFNNILTAIIGFCDLLLQRHVAGDASFSDINQIKQNANRAANLVRQLLAFSRQQTLRPTVLQVTDVLAELHNLLKRLLGEKISLKMVHGRDLGAVRADPGQLEQVIVNLAVNARDAMADGGSLTLKTYPVSAAEVEKIGRGVMPPTDYVAIEVSDTGTGIPPDIQAKIFEPFFTTKDVGKGTGLGLSTVYGIVKQTGGFIFVDSTPGKGATFLIYLPVHQGEPIAQEQPEAKKAEAIDDLWGSGTVLLVEDEDAVRMFAKRALEKKGYKVLEAASGEEALDLLETETGPVDLLISDVVMPNMDGPTLVRKVKGERPDLRIIFISGYAQDSLRQSIDNPDTAFLPKPFSLKQLAEAVKTVMSQAA